MKILIFVTCLAVVYSEADVKGYQYLSYKCDFKDLCDFHGNTTQMEWTIVDSKTGEPNPYLQAEAKDSLDKTKLVLSRCYSVTSPHLCLSFKYFVKGSDDARLTLRQKAGDKNQKWESKKEIVNKGWTEVNINVSLLPGQSKAQFMFLALLGGTAGNIVGIDDVTLTPYEC